MENFDEFYSVVHLSLLLLHLSVQRLVHLTVQVLVMMENFDEVFSVEEA